MLWAMCLSFPVVKRWHDNEAQGGGRRGGISLGGEMKLAWSEKVRRWRKERDGWGGYWGRRVRWKPVRERVTRCAILSFTGRWCCVTSLQWHCHLPCHCDTTLTWVNLCDIILYLSVFHHLSTRTKNSSSDLREGLLKKIAVLWYFDNVSRLPPPPQICFDWPPPKFSKCWNHIHFARHLAVFRPKGGAVWDSDVFF